RGYVDNLGSWTGGRTPYCRKLGSRVVQMTESRPHGARTSIADHVGARFPVRTISSRPKGPAMRRLLVALCLPLFAVPLAACDPVVPAGQVVYCTVMADPPVPDAAGKVMRGNGWFVCDRPGPDTLTLTVAL